MKKKLHHFNLAVNCYKNGKLTYMIKFTVNESGGPDHTSQKIKILNDNFKYRPASDSTK